MDKAEDDHFKKIGTRYVYAAASASRTFNGTNGASLGMSFYDNGSPLNKLVRLNDGKSYDYKTG